MAHDRTPQNRSIEHSARALRKANATAIEEYLAGVMPPEARNAFVKRFTEDRPLRLAVLTARLETAPSCSLSEAAFTAWAKINESMGDLNGFHPLSRGLEGCSESSLEPSRQRHLESIIRNADSLLRCGEIEDVAVESLWIANTNIALARACGEEIAIGTSGMRSGRPSRAKGQGVWPHRKDSSTGTIYPIPHDSYQGTDPSASGNPLASVVLPQLHRTISWKQLRIKDDTLVPPAMRDRIISAMSSDPSLVSELIAELQSPLCGPNLLTSVHTKTLSARLLVTWYLESPYVQRQEAINAVVRQFLRDLPSPIGGPTTIYSAKLFGELCSVLAGAANSSDFIWSQIEEPLFSSLDSGTVGTGHVDGPRDEMQGRDPELVHALTRLPDRISTAGWESVLKSLLTHPFTSVVSCAIEAIRHFPETKKVPLLVSAFGQSLNSAAIYPPTQDPYSWEPSESSLPCIMHELCQCTSEQLRQVSLTHLDLPAPFTGIATFAEYLKREFTEGQFRNVGRAPSFQGDELLLRLAASIDIDLLNDLGIQLLNGWDRRFGNLEDILVAVGANSTPEFRKKALELLERLCKGHPPASRDISEEIVTLLKTTWGLTSSEIRVLGGPHIAETCESVGLGAFDDMGNDW